MLDGNPQGFMLEAGSGGCPRFGSMFWKRRFKVDKGECIHSAPSRQGFRMFFFMLSATGILTCTFGVV